VTIARTIACIALALGSATAGAQGSIAGTVYDSLRTHAPLANAIVVLVERDRYATTDARGHFQIDSVPDGRYTLGFMHAILDSLDMEGPMVPVEVTGGHRLDVMLFAPSAATVYARMCPGRDPGTAAVIGRVRDADSGAPLADATVSTDWIEYTISGGRPASHPLRVASRTTGGGLYMLCGVPTKVPLAIETERAGFLAGPTPLLVGDRLVSRVDFAISLRDSAARNRPGADSTAAATGPRGTATLRGVVRGGGGRPVLNATVAVAGTSRSARTDSTGAFRLDHIPAGTRTIEVRVIGMLPVTASIDFATNSVRDTTLSIAGAAQVLKPVAVETSLMASDGFETRRKQALGFFVTQQEIAQHNFLDLASILRGSRGVHVECLANKRRQGVPCLPMPYFVSLTNFSNTNCTPNYYLDGAPFRVADPTGFADLTLTVPVSSIRGIEVYSNPGGIPPLYDMSSSTGCGSILIWTH
jgi:hypothetical protein